MEIGEPAPLHPGWDEFCKEISGSVTDALRVIFPFAFIHEVRLSWDTAG